MPDTISRLYQLLKTSPEGATPLGSFNNQPYKGGIFSQNDIEVEVNESGQKTIIGLRFRCFLLPTKQRAYLEPGNAKKYEQSTGWSTDIEVFADVGAGRPYDNRNILYHRERALKDRPTAKKDFETVIKALSNMTVKDFAAMAEPTMGKLSIREKMERLAADPPRKLAPPKMHFPGDTIENRDQGINEPFGDEDGLQAAPQSRGELVFRAPGNIGVPLNPMSPTVNEDDTKRRETTPPIYRTRASASEIFTKNADDMLYMMPEVEESETKKIPQDLQRLWEQAHAAIDSVGYTLTLKQVENAAKRVALFANKARKFLNEAQIKEIHQKLMKIDADLMKKEVIENQKMLSWVYSEIDGILNNTHYAVSKVLGVDSGAWYQNKKSSEEIGEFDTHEPVSFDVKMPGPQRQLSGVRKTATGTIEELNEVLNTLVENAGSWEQMESPPENMIVSYEKNIYIPLVPDHPDPFFQPNRYNDDANLNINAMVYSLSSRADLPGEEAEMFEGMEGYMYDVEVNYMDDLIFHRERAFRTKTKGFPGGQSLALAIQQLSNFVDATVDNKTVGQFLEMARNTKGRGEQKLSKKIALDVSPLPKAKVEMTAQEPLILRMPDDLRQRYSDLTRRVTDYAKSVGGNLGALDAYKYRNSPPREWVERELPNAKADMEDISAWGKYVNRHTHDEIADFAGFGNSEPSAVSSTLHTQWAVNADQSDFDTWFRTTKPVIKKDESLAVFLRDRAKANPDHEMSQKYDGWWRKRYLGRVYSQAYQLAKSKWQEYLKSSGTEFAKAEYKDALDLLNKAQKENVPTGDLIDALHVLPFEGDHRSDVESYKTDLDSLVNEGMSSLDLSHDPISRDDRMFGDMVHEGFRWIPARKIIAEKKDGLRTASSDLPIPLYQYGSNFYLVNEGDFERIEKKDYIRADVTRIVPGSSIPKRHVTGVDEFNRKSKLLTEAIHDIQSGLDREAVFLKYGRTFGPDIRRMIDDYLYVQSMDHKAADEEYGDASGGGECSTFWNDQTPDNCEGCTFNVGTGGSEFGYGGCLLTHLFLNSPNKGLGKGDEPAGYDQEHMPGKPSIQK